MIEDFGIGLMVGSGTAVAVFILILILGFAGWMDSGSH